MTDDDTSEKAAECGSNNDLQLFGRDGATDTYATRRNESLREYSGDERDLCGEFASHSEK